MTAPSGKNPLRALGLGRLAYQLYHRPLGWWRRLRADGGFRERRLTEEGRVAMEKAAAALPTLPAPAGAPLEFHLLSGEKFWYQTAFCLWTIARHSSRPLVPTVYDDGTLGPRQRAPLARLFPAVRFAGREEITARLEAHLPAARFPFLRDRWLHYPNIRKLIDPHLGAHGWKLVIDSDLLFFRRPARLIEWLDQPRDPLHAVDCETSYGYSRDLMNTLAGTPVAELVNVGLTGLNGSEIDWERLEHWCRLLIERERTNYYLEQALIAMMVAGRTCTIMPAADYVTLPVEPEASACRAVMHHYVAGSKRHYFQANWRRALTAPG
ncbi:MAG TPA: hypothetical protein VG838_14730 [Opitutaceae bacterium]|nr:hypothetical protein [Opitutaceae bacterium]